jgi:hypothetical protein
MSLRPGVVLSPVGPQHHGEGPTPWWTSDGSTQDGNEEARRCECMLLGIHGSAQTDRRGAGLHRVHLDGHLEVGPRLGQMLLRPEGPGFLRTVVRVSSHSGAAQGIDSQSAFTRSGTFREAVCEMGDTPQQPAPPVLARARASAVPRRWPAVRGQTRAADNAPRARCVRAAAGCPPPEHVCQPGGTHAPALRHSQRALPHLPLHPTAPPPASAFNY